jgi:hypothetical protein
MVIICNKDKWFLFISFVRPKEMNQRKERRKRQPRPFCPPATRGLGGATKKTEVRTRDRSGQAVSGFSLRSLNYLMSKINYFMI